MFNIIQIGQKFLTIHRMLVVGGSGSGITNALFNLIDNKPGIDKVHSKFIKFIKIHSKQNMNY